MLDSQPWEVVIVGGGLAGLSASIYLGRALRRVLVIDDEKSLAMWEPEVQNYFGFPEGISGEELLRRGRQQAAAYGAQFAQDTVRQASRSDTGFILEGSSREYFCQRLLLATGL